MPASPHPVFKLPDDLTSKIWRYLDFTKFISLLDSESLYFSRSDLLGDPFEGSITKATLTQKMKRLEEIQLEAKEFTDAIIIETRKNDEYFNRATRHWFYINCWHMNAHESAAMWSLYTKTNEAIAIRSSIERLCSCLDSICHVGLVEYIDYDSTPITGNNLCTPFLHKRMSFQHENEIRAILVRYPAESGQFHVSLIPPPEEGIFIKVSLSELITEVCVAPTSPKWFFDLVERVVRRYSLTIPVCQSRLDDQPLF